MIPFLLFTDRYSTISTDGGSRISSAFLWHETHQNVQSPSRLMEPGARPRFHWAHPAAPIARVVPTRQRALAQCGADDIVSSRCVWQAQAAVSTGVTG